MDLEDSPRKHKEKDLTRWSQGLAAARARGAAGAQGQAEEKFAKAALTRTSTAGPWQQLLVDPAMLEKSPGTTMSPLSSRN
jgi:hypothetical protein